VFAEKLDGGRRARGLDVRSTAEIINQALFHAEVRFDRDYKQFREEGLFATRLELWLRNVTERRYHEAMLALLARLQFVDAKQIEALYRAAFRRVIRRRILDRYFKAGDELAGAIDESVRMKLASCLMFSVTESFDFPLFLRVNSLPGLRRPQQLGENGVHVGRITPTALARCTSVFVLEDFVGTGKQAGKALAKLVGKLPKGKEVVFTPLLILETGLRALRSMRSLHRVQIEPVCVIHDDACVREDGAGQQGAAPAMIRSLVHATEDIVLQRYDATDDPPDNAYGYQGCGALLVTAHNAPNNTIALVHHRAPQWSPLFRRLHHSKDSL